MNKIKLQYIKISNIRVVIRNYSHLYIKNTPNEVYMRNVFQSEKLLLNFCVRSTQEKNEGVKILLLFVDVRIAFFLPPHKKFFDL